MLSPFSCCFYNPAFLTSENLIIIFLAIVLADLNLTGDLKPFHTRVFVCWFGFGKISITISLNKVSTPMAFSNFS